MRVITDIIIHCSDSPNGRSNNAMDIDMWHRPRWTRDETWRQAFNPQYQSIGYHWVIDVNGMAETGRHPDEIPCAVQGHNSHSINICLVGTDKFSNPQWATLGDLVQKLLQSYPDAVVHGHCVYDTAIAQGKTCPNFDVDSWYANGMGPVEGHMA